MGEPVAVADDALDLALAYDDGGRQKARTLTVDGAKRYELNVTRDDAGRITKRVETVAGTTKTYDYEYWPDGQLKTVRDGATVLESYAYDANGNRLGHTYADDDRMTGTHVFDQAGFLVSRGADTFSYADRGELQSATVGGKTVTYEYDAAQRQAARIENGQRTEFLYGDVNRPFLVTGSRAGGQLTTYYYGVDDRLIALERGGQRYYVGADQVGTPRVITDASGAVVRTFAYDSFGVRDRTKETGTFELPIGFAGGLEDPITGLVRFGLRDYEPSTGRWTARDPILHDGGINLYVYSGSDPVAKRDPSGLDEEVGGDSGDGGATGDFGSEGTGSEGSGGGMLEAIKEFFTREDTGMAIEALAEMEEMDGDSEIAKGASRLKKGMDAIELAEDVAESVVIIQEAEATENLGEEGLGWLRVCAKAIGKIVPVDIFGTGVVDPLLDKAVPHYRDQNRKGSINYQVQQALERNGTP